VTSPARDTRIERLLRDLAPRVLGAVMRRFRDFDACEDAVQEALIAATEQWPRDGVPGNPLAWLVQVALRRRTDQLRSEIARRHREMTVAADASLVIAPAMFTEPALDPNDTLVLLFMCCHPALTPASAIALTLRAVGGLTTSEIATAFMVPEATMAQRISRAKQSIASSNVPFAIPDDDERHARLAAVLHVLYLVFNEGYAATSGGDVHRADLTAEAIRLTRSLRSLLPDDPEVMGLLALMLLTEARRGARTGPHGELIPLDEQDRSRWDRAMIAEGIALVTESLPKGGVGEYRLQAAIAAVHDEAARVEDTDWPQIVALYEALAQVNESPAVALNHAVAVAMVEGPRVGLGLLARLEGDPRLAGTHRLDAVRAHLLERAGEIDEAVVRYRAAAAKTTSVPERNYLMLRAARLAEGEVSTS
jgi:predicted RNA polymerase sigma factor